MKVTPLDRLTPIAVAGALAAIMVAMIMDGSSPAVLFKPAPLLLVFGGTIAVGLGGFMKRDIKDIKSVLKSSFGVPDPSAEEDIEHIFNFASVARKDGLLALESAAQDVTDPFLKQCVQLAVDGTDPEEMQDILEGEIASLEEHNKVGAKFFSDLGGFSPTLGIIGTVVGLIHVLQNLNDPSTIGAAIGSAFTATLWGVLAANVFWLPISNKIKRASQLEVQRKRMIVDGMLAVQAGSSPRMIRARMESHLPPSAKVEANAA
ncbi:MAG TPA: MotA/TolQ/ExbB proton channel family protein [Acidimicrobiales bacterium]|nr:MotA/TolQ/ExbB proton channel family protein [Acidimicrobiales bacterium]